jgi:hypothetical protein
MVSSSVVLTDTTVGLRRAAPHQAAALDLPGGRLISLGAAGFRQGPAASAASAASSSNSEDGLRPDQVGWAACPGTGVGLEY